MQIVQISLSNHRQVKQFLNLSYKIYRNTPQWVPPLSFDAQRMLDQRLHPFYKHSQAAFFLAMDGDNSPIGRLTVLENRNYNDFNNEKTAFFYLFECQENLEASQALFEAGFDWARQRGLAKIIGPKGFTVLD